MIQNKEKLKIKDLSKSNNGYKSFSWVSRNARVLCLYNYSNYDNYDNGDYKTFSWLSRDTRASGLGLYSYSTSIKKAKNLLKSKSTSLCFDKDNDY